MNKKSIIIISMLIFLLVQTVSADTLAFELDIGDVDFWGQPQYTGQSYTVDWGNTKISNITANLKKIGSPTGNFWFEIWSDTGSDQPISLLHNCSTIIQAEDISATGEQINFSCDGYELVNNTVYVFVNQLTFTEGASDYISWRGENNIYTGGNSGCGDLPDHSDYTTTTWDSDIRIYEGVFVAPITDNDKVNLTWVFPVRDNLQQTGSSFTVRAQINHSESVNCSYLMDGVGVINVSYTGVGSQNFSSAFNYFSVVEKKLNFTINCFASANQTFNRYPYYVDRWGPRTIDGTNTYQTNTLNYNITFIDSFLGLVNVTDTCGNSFQNSSGLPSIFNYTGSFDIKSCSLGQQNTTITYKDSPNGTFLYSGSDISTWYNRARINITAITGAAATINNFSIYVNGVFDGNTTSSYYYLDNLTIGSYNISMIPVDPHQNDNVTLTINSSQNYQAYQFILQTMNTLNITYYDVETGNLLTAKVTAQFIGLTAQNRSTTNGNIEVNLLSPDDYTLLSDSATYEQNKYDITVFNKTFQNLKIYMQNATRSELILLKIEDRYGTKLVNAEIIIQRWTNNAWVTEQILSSDFQGQSEGYYVLSTVFYNHVIKYNGITYFGEINDDDDKKLIYTEDVTNGLTFNLNILEGTDSEDYLSTLTDTTINLTFSNTTNTTGSVRFYWKSEINSDLKGTIKVYYAGNQTLKCTNTATSATGIIFCNFASIKKTMFIAVAEIDSVVLDSITFYLGVVDPENKINWGATGFVIGLLVVIVAFFAFLSVPILSIWIGSGVFVLLVLLGFMFKGMQPGVLIGLLAITYFVAGIKSRSGVEA